MFHAVSAIACMLIAAIALWGWGRSASRLAKAPRLSAPVNVATGLAAIVFVGGVLNLLRLAYAPVLDGLVVLGVGFALLEWRIAGWAWPRVTVAHAVAAIPIVLVALLLLAFIVPPVAFNWHDDLERYLAYPVRMLATGTLGGNPLGYLGADSLGAQAFLQAFPAAHFPLRHIAAVDWVFGLLLCMTIAGFGVAPKGWGVSAVMAELLVFAINPLAVNVSSAFTTSFLVLGLVFLTAELRPEGRAPWLLGLFYAALLALKSTNAIFVGLHFAAWWLIQPRTTGASFLRLGVVVGGSSTLCILPWLLTHADNLIRAATNPTRASAPPGSGSESLLLLGRSLAAYGAAPFHYTLLAATAILLGVCAWLGSPREVEERRTNARAILAGGVGGAAAFLVLTVCLAPLVFGQVASFRYAAPVLLGVVPAVIALFDRSFDSSARIPGFVAAAALLVLLAPGTFARVRSMADTGVTLAFLSAGPARSMYVNSFSKYVDGALSDEHRDRIRQIQSLVPANEPIVAWLMTPYCLDFRRNPVFTVEPYGWAMPWSRMPAARYFIWEHQGPAVRTRERYRKMTKDAGAAERYTGARALELIDRFEAAANAGDRLYNDGSIVVWRVRE